MTDLTLSDLASDGASNAAESAAEETAKQAANEANTGEWITGLYDRLRDDGLIMPLLFGPEAAPGQPEQPAETPSVDPTMTDDENPDNLPVPAENDDSGPELNADTIAEICEGIEAKAGDLRISQIRAACQNRPEFVNQLIEQQGDEF